MPQHLTGQFDRERLLSRIDSLSRRVAELESELDRTHRLATIGTMASSIAHEFNNILTPVMSYAQLALQAPQDAPLVERALTKAVEGTEHASEIAAAMLGFVRDEHQENSADVASVVKECVACMAREPAKDGIDLIVEVQPGCRVAMRPIALQQIILNLLLNARAAVKPGSGRLEIRANCSTWNNLGGLGVGGGGEGANGTNGTNAANEAMGGREMVRIEVRDNGCGISGELLPRIFEPFVTSLNGGISMGREDDCGGSESLGGAKQRRSGGDDDGERKGTGLGLAICHRLVTVAGGSIEVESRVGEGTAFVVRLPGSVGEGIKDRGPGAQKAA